MISYKITPSIYRTDKSARYQLLETIYICINRKRLLTVRYHSFSISSTASILNKYPLIRHTNDY